MMGSVKVKVLKGFFERLRGLEFKKPDDKNYLFVNCNCIHTFGMKKLIDVAFVRTDGFVLQVVREVASDKVLKNREAQLTLERFASKKPWVEVGCVYAFEEER